MWLYKSADWNGLRGALFATDWSFIELLSVDDAAAQFTEALLSPMRRFIRAMSVEERSDAYHWFNARCLALIQAKRDAEETDSFGEAARACSAGML